MTKRILIADDDASMRELITRLLDHPSFVINATRNIPDTIEQFQQTGADLAIIDLVMPGGSALEMMDALLTSEKRPKIIVISALAEMFRSRYQLSDDIVVMPKPFAVDALRKLVFTELGVGDPKAK